jgi:hypothetical protein
MQNEIRRINHAELALTLGAEDQRVLDLLTQRPHLLNPHPNIIKRLAKRSRRFRMKRRSDFEERLPRPPKFLRAEAVDPPRSVPIN